jgi:6-phosphofructokinase 2
MPPRIVTLTVNPALDVAMEAGEVRPGHKIRTHGVMYDPGGGGINVARVIHALGGESVAIFVVGGYTGRFVEDMLVGSGVACQAVGVAVTTRVSLTVHETASGAEYKFVPESGLLTPSDVDRVLSTIAGLEADWLVASGSLPAGFPVDFYAKVADLAHRRNVRFALDTSGLALKAARHQGVDLLKMSLGEFQSLTGTKACDRDALAREASQLCATGTASMIALTLGEQGAILATPDRCIALPALSVPVHSTVGAGDSFLAGLVLGLARSQSPEEALRLAVATGAAAVMGRGTARVSRQHVDALLVRL